jgi:cytochrome c oxidase cbb3-type subunit 1
VRSVLSEIDASIRFPALFFVISAILWLVVGTALKMISAYQTYEPNFMAGCEFFTYGRIHPSATIAMLFGWGCNVIFAIGLWIIARLSLAPFRNAGLLIVAGLFWNFGISFGILGIFNGDQVGVGVLALPGYITPLLLIAYALIGAWGVLAFRSRCGTRVYVSQWYILGAIFWFPWTYMITQFMVIWFPARGVVQSIVSHWFDSSFQNLWLVPMALATAYYVIPKVLGRPIYSSSLALLGFVSLALFGSWTGPAHLIGGPVPVWIPTVGIVASVLLIIPSVAASLNLFLTAKGARSTVWRSPSLRFVMFGVFSYFFATLLGSVMALRSVNEVSHFTTFSVGQDQQLVYAFFSMVMFGGLYYMVPRLTQREWPSSTMIFCHFWGSAFGISVIVAALLLGGWLAGFQMNDAEVHFIDIVQAMVPWHEARSIGIVCLAIGHMAFAINFLWMLFATGSIRAKQSPSLLESGKQGGAA